MRQVPRMIYLSIVAFMIWNPVSVMAGPLHDMAASGDAKGIEAAVNHEPSSIDAKDKWGWTPLMHAAISRQVDSVRLLLDRGANPLLKDSAGLTALDWARGSAANCNEQYIQQQLQNLRANKVAEEEIQATLQRLREKFSAGSAEKWNAIAKMLEDDAMSRKENSEKSSLFESVRSRDVEAVKRLLASISAGDLEQQDTRGRTPFIVAVQQGDIPMVELLLANGASYTATDAAGRSAYDYARQMFETIAREKSSRERAQLRSNLASDRAGLDEADENGETAVMRAAAGNDVQAVQILVEAGADLGVKNHKGEGIRELVGTRTPASKQEALILKIIDDASSPASTDRK